VPCPFRIKYNGDHYCGKRIPLECSPDVCPFGPEAWVELVKRDKNVERVWIMPKFELMTIEEGFELARADPKIYLVKAMSYHFRSQR